MEHDFYILGGKDEHEAIPVDELSWFQWWFLETGGSHHVALDRVDGQIVSTIFLGIDHAPEGASEPTLFETRVFSGGFAEFRQRYNTWDEAVAGHRRACALVARVNAAPTGEK